MTPSTTAPPPPAPFIGPSPTAVIQQLQAKAQLPITVGKYSPKAAIDLRQGEYVFFELARNQAHADDQTQAERARGIYVPEMAWRGLQPGRLLATGKSLDEFLPRLKKAWRADLGASR